MTLIILQSLISTLLIAQPAPNHVGLPPDYTSLCEIHTATSGPYDHSHAYPTGRTFSNDSEWLFVESAGPDAKGVIYKNARHLIAIHLESGRREYLATTRHPNPDKPAAWFGFDYANDADCLVYIGPDNHCIHMVNRKTGATSEVMTEPEGEIGGPLSIAQDGSRIAYWVMYPSKANRFFDDYITVIFTIDVDPETCKAVSTPRIIEAFPRRKGPTFDDPGSRDGIHVNHPQINPTNKDHLCYAHEMLGSQPDGTIERSRLWHATIGNTINTYLIHQPKGLHFTHEVIAPDGKSLIFPYMFGVGQVFFDTGKRHSIYFNKDCCPGHLTISPDGQWIAGDTWGQWKDDAGRTWQSVMLFEVATRRYAHIAWFNHSHPHPIFSPDGTKIAFSYHDDHNHQQVAWIDVTNVREQWDKVHHGTGGIASPAWLDGVGP